MTGFLVMLFFYWMVSFERVGESDPHESEGITNKKRIAFFLVLFVCVSTLNLLYYFNLEKSASINAHSSVPAAIVVFVIFVVLLLLVLLVWNVFMIIKACRSFAHSKLKR